MPPIRFFDARMGKRVVIPATYIEFPENLNRVFNFGSGKGVARTGIAMLTILN